MSELGYYVIIFAYIISLYSFFISILRFIFPSKKEVFYLSLKNSQISIFILLTIASFALFYLFVTHDFKVRYVAEYSSKDMPIYYILGAFWAGQDGSLLLWAFFLSLFTVIIIYTIKEHKVLFYILVLLNFNNLLFLTLIAFLNNPFSKLDISLQDGLGLNPLLQHPLMLIHPPILYLGYVGFAIPFAIIISALITNRVFQYLKIIRVWSIISWLFLGLGILLGAKWAYVELGWGGYWAWDPVENASLMPWLTATSAIHSIFMEQTRKIFKFWNIFLITITHLLCIFGTFLTRSGIISSVHAFGKSSVGVFFIGFIVIELIIVVIVLLFKYKNLESEKKIELIISKESGFLFNNLLFLLTTLIIFLGTIYPVISEIILGLKKTLSPQFFNKTTAPLGIVIFSLTLLCIFFSFYKKRNGIYIIHIGVIFIFIGIVGSAYSIEKDIIIPKGEFYQFKNYKLKYKGVTELEKPHYNTIQANVELYKGNNLITLLTPEKRFYKKFPKSPSSEVAIYSSLFKDIYLIFGGIEEKQGIFKLYINPLVSFIWLGGYSIILGTIVILLPFKKMLRRFFYGSRDSEKI